MKNYYAEDVLRPLQDVLETRKCLLVWRRFCKTSWRCREDVWPWWTYSSWSRHLKDLVTTHKRIHLYWSRHLEDVLWRRRQKTSSSRRLFTGLVFLKIFQFVNKSFPPLMMKASLFVYFFASCQQLWPNSSEILLISIIWRSSHRRCSIKKVFLKFRKIHRKTPVLKSVFK